MLNASLRWYITLAYWTFEEKAVRETMLVSYVEFLFDSSWTNRKIKRIFSFVSSSSEVFIAERHSNFRFSMKFTCVSRIWSLAEAASGSSAVEHQDWSFVTTMKFIKLFSSNGVLTSVNKNALIFFARVIFFEGMGKGVWDRILIQK